LYNRKSILRPKIEKKKVKRKTNSSVGWSEWDKEGLKKKEKSSRLCLIYVKESKDMGHLRKKRGERGPRQIDR